MQLNTRLAEKRLVKTDKKTLLSYRKESRANCFIVMY